MAYTPPRYTPAPVHVKEEKPFSDVISTAGLYAASSAWEKRGPSSDVNGTDGHRACRL